MTAREDLIASTRPPDDPQWFKSETTSVFADLIGSACSLIQAAPLIDKFLAAHQKEAEFGFWSQEELYDDFLRAVPSEEMTDIAWGHSDNFCAWASLFFLNKAEKNLAAALDICLNAWLRWRLEMKWKDLYADDAWLWIYPTTRIRMLKSLVQGDPAKILNSMTTFFEKYDSRKARSFVRKWRRPCAGMSLGEVYDHFIGPKGPSPEECAVVVFCRVNDFKHRVQGLMDRRGIDYAIEWATACRAHTAVSSLWKDGVIANTEDLWTKKKPAARRQRGVSQ